MRQDIITSIDFGSKKLSAAITEGVKGNLEILAVKSCNSAGIEKGLLTDVQKCKEVTINLLKELEEKTKRDIKDIAIGISSNMVRIKETAIQIELKEEKVTIEDVTKALKNGKNSITLSDNECIIDEIINFYILDDKVIYKDILNWKGKQLEINFTFVIGQVKEVEKYYEIFKETKYNIKFIKLNILSGKQIFINEKNSLGNIALVDIGSGIIDIAIFNDGIPKNISIISVGGNNITKDLSICGKFSFLEADNIKKIYSSNYKNLYKDNSTSDEIKVGTTKVSKKLFYDVVNARIEEILSQINIKLKNTGHYDRIYSIILYGDGINYFEEINEIIRNIIKIPTKVITKNELGIKNSENITCLAIAKEVYDRLNLLDGSDMVSTNRSNRKKYLYDNENKNHIIKKVRSFFDKIF